MPLVTSYSSLHTYMQCPRAWYLKDLRGLGPVIDQRHGALGFGSRFHEALEVWGRTGVPATEVWHTLMSREYEIAAERGGLGIEELGKEDRLGLVMLDGFEDWYATEGDDQEYEVIAIEKKLSNLLEVHTQAGEPVEIHLYGKLDQLLRHREFGTYVSRDWKTSKNLPDVARETLENSPQPRIYKALLQQQLPEHPIAGVRYTIFRKVLRTGQAKPPFIFNFDLSLSQYNVNHHLQRVEAIAGRMVDTAQALQAGVPHTTAAPFNPGWYCKSCPFRLPCQLMQGTSLEAAEDMLADKFQPTDPLARYKDEQTET